jgi:hypothetical protein
MTNLKIIKFAFLYEMVRNASKSDFELPKWPLFLLAQLCHLAAELF